MDVCVSFSTPFHQVERFLDTENAALVSMHYPQARQGAHHFDTTPFDKNPNGELTAEGVADEEDAEGGRGEAGGMAKGGSDGGGVWGEEIGGVVESRRLAFFGPCCT